MASSMERAGRSGSRRYKTIMQSLRKRLSFRKKKDSVPECSKPHQWQEDEKKVRDGSCSFQVRYLGYIEVFDSRGMHICEEAVKAMKSQFKGKYQRALLYVSGDALRVVDEVSKSMIVDQTIEKVSFCAPDRSHEKGFAYICRDGTTRRWMCHGFLAAKESFNSLLSVEYSSGFDRKFLILLHSIQKGERLSHAVGCAFAICLEKKQKRDKETGVTVTYNQSRTSFERTGSFRHTTLTERIVDPQSAILADPVPVRSTNNPYAVQRPHASANLLERQGSFRGFEKLQESSSPFKRTLSLRLNELPSTLQRQNAIMESPTRNGDLAIGGATPDVSQEQEDSIAQMCQQLTQGLTALTSDDPFSGVPNQGGSSQGHVLTHQTSLPTHLHHSDAVLTRQRTLPAPQTLQPARQPVTNPWGNARGSEIAPITWTTATAPTKTTATNSTKNNNPFTTTAESYPQPQPAIQNGSQHTFPQASHEVVNQLQHPHHGTADSRSQFSSNTGTARDWQTTQPRKHDSLQNGAVDAPGPTHPWPVSAHSVPSTSPKGTGVDPFDVAWAAKSLNGSNPNPFGTKSVNQFQVQL